MKKNFFFKGVSILGAVLLLANVVLPGINVYAGSDDTWTWDYVHDETSWNSSATNGALKVYYANNPSEDLWNGSVNPARVCNFNDQVYIAQICDDSNCSQPTDATLTTTWGETYQTVNDSQNSYLLTMSAKVGSDDIYELYQQQVLCTLPNDAPSEAYFPTANGGANSWAEPDWGCAYAVPFESLCTLPDEHPAGAYFPEVGGHSWAEPDYGCAYAVPFEATNNQCTLPSDAPAGAEITEYVAAHPEEGCYYKLPAVPSTCTLPSDAPAGAVFQDWMVTDQGVCYYKMNAVSPQIVPSGKYVKLLSSKYSEACHPTYEGWLANLKNAQPNQQAPWIVISFNKKFKGTIKFNYTDYQEGADVYPRGAEIKDWGPEGKSRGVAAIPGEFPGVNDFDIAKFSATLVPITEKGEAKIEDGSENGAEMVLEAEKGDTLDGTVIEGKLETSTTTAELEGVTVLEVYKDSDNDGAKDGSALNTGVNFTKAVLVRIPVKSKKTVKIKVMHNGKNNFELLGLAKQAGDCAGGIAKEPENVYTGEEIPTTLGYAEIYTCQASTFVAYTETAKSAPASTSSYSGGGGSGGSRTATTKTDNIKANTGDTAKVDETKTEGENTTEENKVEEKAPMTDDEAVAKYGQEQVDAYKWALENGITTMKTVEEARLDQPLTRAELAKMMVVYVAKVLGKSPILTGDVNYGDVKVEELGDLAGYIKLAYQYQIMGINADGTQIDDFNPFGIVSRGEYATVFSRVLFGSLFNKEGEDFYTNHIEALNKAGILSNTNPTIQEMRGWVMLMMYRSSQNADKIAAVIEELGATEQEVIDAQVKAEEGTGALVGIANPASVYCEEQGGVLSIVEDEEGNQSGMCKLADGTEVEEWEYYRTNHADEVEATSGDVVEAPEVGASTGDSASN